MSETVLVADVGSASLKAGYAGDDAPITYIPSVPQKFAAGVEVMESTGQDIYDSEFSKPLHPVCRGSVKNWEQLEQLWRITMDDMNVDASDSFSVLIMESPRGSVSDRSKWAEMLFETFRIPSLYIANTSALSLFAAGRTTGTVVECGAGLTSCIPVFEGLPLVHALNTMDYAGQDITLNIQHMLDERGITVDNNYARMLKERLAFAAKAATPASERVHFELPDGKEVNVEKKAFADAVEPLFTNPDFDPAGLSTQVFDSLSLCDDSILKDVSQNIILAGGSTMMTGFGDRLEKDLKNMASAKGNVSRGPRSANIRVIPTSTYREAGFTTQRRIAAWIGGSIVASLDNFRQMKITRQEWEENADSCVRTKFI